MTPCPQAPESSRQPRCTTLQEALHLKMFSGPTAAILQNANRLSSASAESGTDQQDLSSSGMNQNQVTATISGMATVSNFGQQRNSSAVNEVPKKVANPPHTFSMNQGCQGNMCMLSNQNTVANAPQVPFSPPNIVFQPPLVNNFASNVIGSQVPAQQANQVYGGGCNNVFFVPTQANINVSQMQRITPQPKMIMGSMPQFPQTMPFQGPATLIRPQFQSGAVQMSGSGQASHMNGINQPGFALVCLNGQQMNMMPVQNAAVVAGGSPMNNICTGIQLQQAQHFGTMQGQLHSPTQSGCSNMAHFAQTQVQQATPVIQPLESVRVIVPQNLPTQTIAANQMLASPNSTITGNGHQVHMNCSQGTIMAAQNENQHMSTLAGNLPQGLVPVVVQQGNSGTAGQIHPLNEMRSPPVNSSHGTNQMTKAGNVQRPLEASKRMKNVGNVQPPAEVNKRMTNAGNVQPPEASKGMMNVGNVQPPPEANKRMTNAGNVHAPPKTNKRTCGKRKVRQTKPGKKKSSKRRSKLPGNQPSLSCSTQQSRPLPVAPSTSIKLCTNTSKQMESEIGEQLQKALTNLRENDDLPLLMQEHEIPEFLQELIAQEPVDPLENDTVSSRGVAPTEYLQQSLLEPATLSEVLESADALTKSIQNRDSQRNFRLPDGSSSQVTAREPKRNPPVEDAQTSTVDPNSPHSADVHGSKTVSFLLSDENVLDFLQALSDDDDIPIGHDTQPILSNEITDNCDSIDRETPADGAPVPNSSFPGGNLTNTKDQSLSSPIIKEQGSLESGMLTKKSPELQQRGRKSESDVAKDAWEAYFDYDWTKMSKTERRKRRLYLVNRKRLPVSERKMVKTFRNSDQPIWFRTFTDDEIIEISKLYPRMVRGKAGKRVRNRIIAQQDRERKKKTTEILEAENEKLRSHCSSLEAKLSTSDEVTAENTRLRDRLRRLLSSDTLQRLVQVEIEKQKDHYESEDERDEESTSKTIHGKKNDFEEIIARSRK